MQRIIYLSACLLFFVFVSNNSFSSHLPEKAGQSVDTIFSDLDLDGKRENIQFSVQEIEFGDWKTSVFIDGAAKPILIVDDLLISSRVHDISNSIKILELQTSAGGKLANSLLYQYRHGELIEILVDTNSAILGTWSSGGAEFKDNDGDGILEMFVYHRYYPPETNRTVEIYKFNGLNFEKMTEYEETTPDMYL